MRKWSSHEEPLFLHFALKQIINWPPEQVFYRGSYNNRVRAVARQGTFPVTTGGQITVISVTSPKSVWVASRAATRRAHVLYVRGLFWFSFVFILAKFF